MSRETPLRLCSLAPRMLTKSGSAMVGCLGVARAARQRSLDLSRNGCSGQAFWRGPARSCEGNGMQRELLTTPKPGDGDFGSELSDFLARSRGKKIRYPKC